MMKFLFDVFQVLVVIKIGLTVLKWTLFKKVRRNKRRNQKTLLQKVWMLATNKLHHYLNQKLIAQKEALRAATHKTSADGKIIPFKKTN